MHYTKEYAQKQDSRSRNPNSVWRDWLELETELTKLREAAAAVVEAATICPPVDYSPLDVAIDNLNVTIGIAAPQRAIELPGKE